MVEHSDHKAVRPRLFWACDAQAVLRDLDPVLQAWDGASLLDSSRVIDPTQQLATAFATRSTFSALRTQWQTPTHPVVTLRVSGLPQRDGAGDFIGYRGFAVQEGVGPLAEAPPPPPQQDTVPLPEAEHETFLRQPQTPPSIVDLTAREQQAFHEIGRLLAEDVMAKLFQAQQYPSDFPSDSLPDETSPIENNIASPVMPDDQPDDEPVSVARLSDQDSSEDQIFQELAASVRALHEQPVERRPSDLFAIPADIQALLDRLPVGILVSRGDVPIVMNKMLLQTLGYDSADDFHAAGAIHDLFAQQPSDEAADHDHPSTLMHLQTRLGKTVSMRVMFQTLPWGYLPASMMVFVPADLLPAEPVGTAHEFFEPLPHIEIEQAEIKQVEINQAEIMPVEKQTPQIDAVYDEERQQRLLELEAILDTATDGVIVLDGDGVILSLNSSAEALFGYDAFELAGVSYLTLFAPESRMIVCDYLEGVRENGVRSLMNDGREVTGLEKQGRSMPLFMTLGRTSLHGSGRFCAVLRDLTAWKKVESDLKESRRQAELANSQKSDTLARISHELRTPLSAIMGFAEVMVEERFGPVGNERYRDYLRDIHQSGQHLLSLVNDLLDLAKIEAGKFDLDFAAVDANATVRAALAMIRPEADRHHVFLRSALASTLPMIVADERTLRQVVINLLSNAVKFTEAGGQVIVTTTLSDEGEVALRIRDTGVGMDSDELKMALELFRQTAAGRKAGGTGLGLPLTKALAEANRARFAIKSERGRGTLVEIIFPSNRVLVS